MQLLTWVPWVILIVAAIVAVPVAAKMSPSPTYSPSEPGNDEMAMEGDYVEEVAGEDFAADPNDFQDQPLEDDAFAEFN